MRVHSIFLVIFCLSNFYVFLDIYISKKQLPFQKFFPAHVTLQYLVNIQILLSQPRAPDGEALKKVLKSQLTWKITPLSVTLKQE